MMRNRSQWFAPIDVARLVCQFIPSPKKIGSANNVHALLRQGRAPHVRTAILVRHRANILRLLAGTEARLGH
ncbi:hypothetical protein GPL21_23870 [Bradyrhizobium pachyrhizi]|uniref:Transposase n=1 Tax=Bradyrhizobium pachyrhizi TaxID=280333 RepID=A0A844SXT8_9BRAD|nr:hypothetical protein [Bradyrhizobium pachyrhizi]MVT68142.1 hypothetical protein [Bradyrhizobium pachyrhizi]